jgi:hypothetical protein
MPCMGTSYAPFGPAELMWSPRTTMGMIRRKDEEHLSWATDQGRALYSFNVGDYHEIHTEWTTAGRNHAGIILAR